MDFFIVLLNVPFKMAWSAPMVLGQMTQDDCPYWYQFEFEGGQHAVLIGKRCSWSLSTCLTCAAWGCIKATMCRQLIGDAWHLHMACITDASTCPTALSSGFSIGLSQYIDYIEWIEQLCLLNCNQPSSVWVARHIYSSSWTLWKYISYRSHLLRYYKFCRWSDPDARAGTPWPTCMHSRIMTPRLT